MLPMKTLWTSKVVAVIFTISWMIVIFYLSHQPASVSSELSGSFVDMIVTISSYFPFTIDPSIIHFFIRKSAHFIAYFILGLFMIHTFRLMYTLTTASVMIAFGMTVLYAISDEVHQRFIPGRSGEVRDVLIDSVGSLMGIGVYLLLYFIYQKVTVRR